MTETGSATSVAVQIAETGGPEVMQLVRRPHPVASEGEMTVAVAAAGVNFIDTYHRSGLYDLPLPVVLGQEGAGIVLEVGAGVDGFAPGDQVAWAGSMGSYAERAAVKASVAFKVPDGVGLDTAASIGVQGLTAHYLVTDCPRIGPGDRCLVHAAGGGT